MDPPGSNLQTKHNLEMRILQRESLPFYAKPGKIHKRVGVATRETSDETCEYRVASSMPFFCALLEPVPGGFQPLEGLS